MNAQPCTNALRYMAEFPDFDWEVPACVTTDWGFEDVSWHNDSCPSFQCDVFMLYVDFTDPLKREFVDLAKFVMTDEEHVVLETDNWEDVRTFVEDGKRDFHAYVAAAPINTLTAAFAAFVEKHSLPRDCDANDLLVFTPPSMTPDQHAWVTAFAERWEQEALDDPAFYDKQHVVGG